MPCGARGARRAGAAGLARRAGLTGRSGRSSDSSARTATRAGAGTTRAFVSARPVAASSGSHGSSAAAVRIEGPNAAAAQPEGGDGQQGCDGCKLDTTHRLGAPCWKLTNYCPQLSNSNSAFGVPVNLNKSVVRTREILHYGSVAPGQRDQ